MTSKGGKHCEDCCFYINNIVKYLSRNCGIQFTEFVGDFIKDQNQIWWFVGAKAFIIANPTGRFKLNHFTFAIDEYESIDEEVEMAKKR